MNKTPTIKTIIESVSPVVTGIRFLPSGVVVDCNPPQGWIISETDTIGYYVDSQNNDSFIYGKNGDVNVDDLIEFVNGVIKYNKEKELKNNLLIEKTAELTKVINSYSFDELSGLTITIK